MGKQSSRLYFQGKDHKDIYFQGNYHDAMYVGSQLVWEKLDDAPTPLLSNEIGSKYVSDGSIVWGITMYNDGTVGFNYGTDGYYFTVFKGDNINETMWGNGTTEKLRKINGNNFGWYDLNTLSIIAPNENILIENQETSGFPNSYEGGYCNGMYLFYGILVFPSPFSKQSISVDGISENALINSIYIDGNKVESFEFPTNNPSYTVHNIQAINYQWFNGILYANLSDDNTNYGTCYTTDMVNWTSGAPISGTGTVINDILFLNNGVAVDSNMDIVGYTKKPAFYFNGYYYAEELQDGYLLRSKDLKEWEYYRRVKGGGFTVKAYWKEKRYLCLEAEDGIYKCKMNLQ